MSRRGQSPTSYSALTSNSVFSRHLNISHAIAKDRGVAGDCHQKTLSSTGRLNRRDMLGDERCAEVLTAPVRWVADDKQSFSVAEKQSFKKFVHVIFRNYKLPSRRTLGRALVDEFESAMTQFRSVLDGVSGRFGLTLCCWSSRVLMGDM
jgi:hypothetical protein